MAIKYCPQCGGEYQEWAEKCVDCGVALTDTKPDFNPKKKTKSEAKVVTVGDHRYVKEPLVAIASFVNTVEANFNKGILESESIPSIITSTDAIIAYQPDSSAVGNIHLVVKESDAATAKEILDSIQKDIPEDGIITEEFPAEELDERDPG